MTATLENIPTYYLADWRGWKGVNPNQVTRVPPARKVADLNKEITKLHPKLDLVEVISRVAVGVLVTIFYTTAFISSGVSIHLVVVFPVFCRLIYDTILKIQDYMQLRVHCSSIKNQIKEMSRDFYYMHLIVSDIGISASDFDKIKKFLPKNKISADSIYLPVRERIHYKLSGGEIGIFSNKPLELSVIDKAVYKQEVLLQYKPWIDLLLELEHANHLTLEEKNELGLAIGEMIHKPNLWSESIDRFFAVKAKQSPQNPSQNFFFFMSESKNKAAHILKIKDGEETKYFRADDLRDFLTKT